MNDYGYGKSWREMRPEILARDSCHECDRAERAYEAERREAQRVVAEAEAILREAAGETP